MMHKKGLKIQVWTVNDSVNQLDAIAIKPDVIQTDYGLSGPILNYKNGN